MTDRPDKGGELARGERLQVMPDPAEIKVLDDFRYANRMPSRAAATRKLLRRSSADTAMGLT